METKELYRILALGEGLRIEFKEAKMAFLTPYMIRFLLF